MSIRSIGSAWRTNQTTGDPGARDDRVLIGFRNRMYPDIARDTRNYVDRADCESTTEPTLRGEANDTNSNTTFARSAVVAHGGEYSMLLTKTAAAGTEGYTAIQDGVLTTDMHGFVAGETIEAAAWVYVPATGGPAVTEVTFRLQQYYGAAWNATTLGTASEQDAWHKLSARVTLNDACAAARFEVVVASTAENAGICYWDNFDIRRYASFTLAREDNLIDRGNCESVTAPAINGTTPAAASNCTWARSSDFARSGDYAYLLTKTIAAGTAGFVFVSPSQTTNMVGFKCGETVEFSAYAYVPTASGIALSECGFQVEEYDASVAAWSALLTVTAAAGALDSWVHISGTFTIPSDDVTGIRLYFYAASTAALNEYFYVDDIKVSRHSVPGSHYLSGGYTEHLCPLTETGTLRIKFSPTFAYDTAVVTQRLFGWTGGVNRYFYAIYEVASDKFGIFFNDLGTVQGLYSARYDDGTSFRNINQWIELVVAWDLSTGTTAGSSLWLNKTQDDTTWTGAIAAFATSFNKLQLRAFVGTMGGYDIAYAEYFPNYVVTDAEVQSDFASVTCDRIHFPMDGHATGTERCDVTRFVQNIGIEKAIADDSTGKLCANRLALQALNFNGEFSDDQYAAYNPELDQFNGTASQRYLRDNCRLWVESWHGSDFDSEFSGHIREGFRRNSPMTTASVATVGATDHAGALAAIRTEVARIWEACNLVDDIEINSLLHLMLREGFPRVRQYLANNSFEDATITDSWAASGGTWSRQAAPLFGTYCGRLVPGAGTQYVYQIMTFTGTKKLNVGDTYTFAVYLLSSAAATGANNWIRLQEADSGGANDSTDYAYSLAGGEGWVRCDVTHTVTDADSDRLYVYVSAAAGDTVDIDGAMLIEGTEMMQVFRESSIRFDDTAASGTVSAADADEIGWDVHGFDIEEVSYEHEWKLLVPGSNLWSAIASFCSEALEPIEAGFDESGTFRLRTVLASGYADQVPMLSLDDTEIMTPLGVDVLPAFNTFRGIGYYIYKHLSYHTLWDARAADLFTLDTGGNFMDQPVLNGATWPAISGTGEFVAKFGDTKYKIPEAAEAEDDPDDEKQAELTPWQKFWDFMMGPFINFSYDEVSNTWTRDKR